MATPVEQIKDRLSILDVVGGYVKLSKSGKHWKGKSPFTSEKTPSFFVSPERGMYYCFSTGKGGDMFTFMTEMEGVDFKGALKLLAERAGVQLESERPEDRTERETLYTILEEATRFYVSELMKSPSSLEYLTKRGVIDATLEKWRIGFAVNDWRTLFVHLKNKGFSPELIMKAGLAKGSERSAEPYDTFRNRIMFPIFDASGRPVGFSGRDMSGDVAAPKYVNSPETPLYEKSRILFGYDKAKQGIRTFDFTLIVEGQFDLVLSHQAGYTNTVAISGTAMTDAHVELISRLSKKAVLALDADQAGIASAKRSATLMLLRDMDVKVAHIEGGKDPADLVREDPKLLKTCIGKSLHVIPFLIDTLKRETQDERAFKLRVRAEVVPFVVLLPNRIDAEHFEGVIAEATSTTTDAIHHEVERVRLEQKKDRDREVATLAKTHHVASHVVVQKDPAPARTEEIVRYLFGILLWQHSIESPRILPTLLDTHLRDILGEERIRTLEDWSSEEKNKAVFLVEAVYADGNEKTLLETVEILLRELQVRILRALLKETRSELIAAEQGGDTARKADLIGRANDVQRRLIRTESTEGRTFILHH